MNIPSSVGLGLVTFALFTWGALGGEHSDAERARICRPGFSATIRPPFEVTNAIKKRLMREKGIPLSEIHEWRLDHICPLELDCPPLAPSNLQLQRKAEAEMKDRLLENPTKWEYCAGRISLPQARGRFVP